MSCQVSLPCGNVTALVTVVCSNSLVLDQLVSLKVARVCGFVRADITVVSNSLVQALFMSCQVSLVYGNVAALVARIFSLLFLPGLDVAGLNPGVLQLVEAGPGEHNINSALHLTFDV